MHVAKLDAAASAADDVHGRTIAVGWVGAIHVGICDGEILEGEARAIGRIEAADRAVASALIAERVLNQDRSRGIRWGVVIREVSVALIPSGMIPQNGHTDRLRSRIQQP